MKAPDKIYISKSDEESGEFLLQDWSGCPRKEVRCIPIEENIEYIRKDTLLEWVELAYGKVSMNLFDCSNAFDELIKKIESL